MPKKNYNQKPKKPYITQRIGLKKQLVKPRLWIILSVIALFGTVMYFQRDYEPPAPLSPPPANAIYKQSNQPVDKRVHDLLQRMTLEEKIGQMALVDKNSVQKPVDVSRYGLGAVLSGAGAKPSKNTPDGWLEMTETLKNQAKQSRLGIPLLFGVDATHGHANVPGSTVFPHAIGLGAANDLELTRSVAKATAEELTATGVNWNFAPMLDAPEDIRWGRTYEAFSSDPELNARLGSAYIEGMQQSNSGQNFVLSTAKHYLGVGSMQWLSSNNKKFKIDQGKVPERNDLLDSQYLVPFVAAVKADVASVMVGLTQYGDKRIIDNRYLVTDKLKSELGFSGFVVSDWYGVYEFSGVSKYQANVTTINAGLDMAMLPYEYKDFIKDVHKAVKRGDISEDRIDDAVYRILTQKFKAGLFDNWSIGQPRNLGSSEHRTLARQAVASSAVLLKNSNNLLPLPQNQERILVAGTGADNIGRQCGAWTVEWQGIDGNWLPGATSILQGIKNTVVSVSNVEYEKDANFSYANTKAEVGIAIVSEKPYAEGFGDNPEPMLEPSDIQAIERLKTSAKKVIIVTVSGRPLFMNKQIADADAVVAAWLPGSEGAGIADVLFGSRQFKATLPIAWPSNVNQLPIRSDSATNDGTSPLFIRSFGLKT